MGIDRSTCGNTTSPCKSIDYALSLNTTTAASTLYLLPGTFDILQTIVVNKSSIIIRAQNPTAGVKLRCVGDGEDHCFEVLAGGLSFIGITFTGCDGCHSTLVSASNLAAPPMRFKSCVFDSITSPIDDSSSTSSSAALFEFRNMAPSALNSSMWRAGVGTDNKVAGVLIEDSQFLNIQRSCIMHAFSTSVELLRVQVMQARYMWPYPSVLFDIVNDNNPAYFPLVKLSYVDIEDAFEIGEIFRISAISPTNGSYKSLIEHCNFINNKAIEIFDFPAGQPAIYDFNDVNFESNSVTHLIHAGDDDHMLGHRLEFENSQFIGNSRLPGAPGQSCIRSQGATGFSFTGVDLLVSESLFDSNDLSPIYASEFASIDVHNTAFNLQSPQSVSLNLEIGKYPRATATVHVTNVTFIENKQTPIVLAGSPENEDVRVSIKDTKFQYNIGIAAGAITTSSSVATFTVENSIFEENVCSDTYDDSAAAITCAAHAPPNFRFQNALSLFSNNDPRNFGRDVWGCIVECDLINTPVCTEAIPPEEGGNELVPVTKDKSWIVLGALIIASAILIFLAFLFVGFAAQNMRRNYDSM